MSWRYGTICLSVERAVVLPAAFYLSDPHIRPRRLRLLIVKQHSGMLALNPLNFTSPAQRFASFQEKIQFEVLRRLYQAPDLSLLALGKKLDSRLGSINFCFWL